MTRRAEQSAPIVRRRYHASAGSVLYIMTTMFLAIGAINSQNNLLFFAFGIAAGAIVISGFVSGPALMGVRARRDLPVTVEVGRPIVVRYTIWNVSRLLPAFGLTITEDPGPATGVDKLGPIRSCVHHVGAGQAVRATTSITPIHRGVASLDRFTLSTTFPLGLTKKSVTFGLPTTVIVRPRQLSVRPGLLDHLDGGVSRLSSARNVAGHGDEMYGLRDYTPGDSLRSIAWRASARSGSLVVRQTSQPAPARLWIELRPSLATLSTHEQEIAVSLAASIARAADARGFAVGVTGFGASLLPKPGRRHIERVLDLLAQLQITTGDVPGPSALARRDGVVVVAAAQEPAPPDAVFVSVADAAKYLAPGERLPPIPPPAVGRLRRAVGEFLGLDSVRSGEPA